MYHIPDWKKIVKWRNKNINNTTEHLEHDKYMYEN